MAYSAITLTTNNSETSEPHKYRLALSNDLSLRNSLVSLTHVSLYYAWRNIKASYNNNKLSYKHIASNKKHSTLQFVMVPTAYLISTTLYTSR